MRYSDCSFFVTLTYEDDSLIFADDEPCLYKRHVQLFFKRLRKYFSNSRIKYYCVGEYGDQWRPISPNGRPHYHALIFYRGKCDWFRFSMKIKEFWQYGIAQVLSVQGAQGYVTKYILKFDKREHLVKPFSLISHGLGIDYLSDSVVSYHRKNLVPYALKPGGYRISLPRYYKDKIFTEYQRLLMKKRSDEYRRDLEIIKLRNVEYHYKVGINPFKERVKSYEQRLYESMKIYKQKKKL